MSLSVETLNTPALLLDKPSFKANIERMRQACKKSGLLWRPHVKTLKSLDAAAYYAPPTGPIAVSTIAEARIFADAGYRDILYAVGLSPDKFGHVKQLLDITPDFTVILDSTAMASALGEASDTFSNPVNVMIELDVDGCRAGVEPSSSTLIDIVKCLNQYTNIRFRGLMAYAGGAYECFSKASLAQAALTEEVKANEAVAALSASGFQCDVLSLGSTPTGMTRSSRSRATEVRTGVCVTMDRTMAALGICQPEDIALSVLTSVIGFRKDKQWLIIDAGWMAMSSDEGAHGLTEGFGVVADIEGKIHSQFILKRMNQEHGIIEGVDGRPIPADWTTPGTKLRLLPNHACATAANFTEYHIVTGNELTTEVWPRLSATWI